MVQRKVGHRRQGCEVQDYVCPITVYAHIAYIVKYGREYDLLQAAAIRECLLDFRNFRRYVGIL